MKYEEKMKPILVNVVQQYRNRSMLLNNFSRFDEVSMDYGYTRRSVDMKRMSYTLHDRSMEG